MRFDPLTTLTALTLLAAPAATVFAPAQDPADAPADEQAAGDAEQAYEQIVALLEKKATKTKDLQASLQKALPRIADFLEKYPESEHRPHLWYTQGMIQAELGQHAAAARTLGALAEAYPDTEYGRGARLARLEMLALSGTVETALKEVEALPQATEDEKMAQRYQKIELLRYAGEHKKALELADEAAARWAGSPFGEQFTVVASKLAKIGTKFADFSLSELRGEETLTLASFDGEVLLVDFWATWWGPCVQELPDVQDAYRRFHGDGFEIFGISLDQSEEKLCAFLDERGVQWPQHFAGRQSEVARKYGVGSIPATFLLDENDVIREVDLSGDALAFHVQRLLDEQSRLEEAAPQPGETQPAEGEG